MKKFFYWLPRVLAILFILFISIFAFDVFEQPKWFLALFMHLIPSFLLVFATIIAWKHERIGGFIFLAFGVLLLIFTNFKSMIVCIPAFIIGVLFLCEDRLMRIQLKNGQNKR
jgi:hypothetical protein